MADEYRGVYEFHTGPCPETQRDWPMRSSVLSADNSLRALHVQAQQVASDPFLSPEGKAEKLATVRAKLGEDIARAQSWLPKAARDLAADEGELFSPGEPHDSNDMERRAWYDALDANTRDEFEAQARAGQHVEIIKALARSPVPGRALTLGQACWRAEVERTKPARVRALETRRRAVQWAEASLKGMARVVRTDPWALTPAETAIDRLTRGRAGRKVG